ncbi:MAG: UDP-N-acetylmuramate dehydrogenase [Candidatus Melainabacteria bacterium]|nr:UDP-N-acetylmuramate dehydrogenase [Candidatus Melainabacteria bacterium]
MLAIEQNTDISKLTTLRVKASAEFFAAPVNLEELVALFKEIKQKNWSWNILGAGSNTLLSSRPLKGIMISTNKLDFVTKLGETQYEVGAGLRMPKFCALMTRDSLAGTEFMEGIPGSVGGGIVMNAGAHGAEISDILVSVKLLNLASLELEERTKNDLDFAYRSSNINSQTHLLVSAVFDLKADDKDAIRARVQTNNKARTTRQPIKSFTCGCTFKNPQAGYGAGQLIDDLGIKGHRVGDFVISNLHGNFFENHGEGTSSEFCELMKFVQAKAQSEKGMSLKPEVKPMGDFSKEELEIWS